MTAIDQRTEDRKKQDEWMEKHCKWWCGRLKLRLASKAHCKRIKMTTPECVCRGCKGVVDVALKDKQSAVNQQDETSMKGLRQMRLERGWDQAELAKRAGVLLGRISAYETGRNQPTYATVQKIRKALLDGATCVEREAMDQNGSR